MNKINDLATYDECYPASVPTIILSHAGLSKNEIEKVSAFKLALGEGTEIDLELLHSQHPHLANSIARYYISALELWGTPADQLANRPYKKLKRNIYYNKMIDSKSQRTDLRLEIKLLSAIPVAGLMVKDLLSANPDTTKFESKYSALNLQLSKNKDGSSNISFTLPSNKPWPALLGGNSAPGEFERNFNLKISWAPWRDRRNRRLVELSIFATEIWPK